MAAKGRNKRNILLPTRRRHCDDPTYPLIAKSVSLSSQSSDALDSHKLAGQRFPKVHAILVRLEARVTYRDERLVVRNCKDIAVIKTTVLLPGRLDVLLADDAGSFAFKDDSLDSVATGYDSDVAGVDDLGKVEVVFGGAVFGDVAVDGDEVAGGHIAECIAAEDVDAEYVRLGKWQVACEKQSIPLRRAVVVVRLRRADPESTGTFGRDKTSDVLDAWTKTLVSASQLGRI